MTDTQKYIQGLRPFQCHYKRRECVLLLIAVPCIFVHPLEHVHI